MVSDFVVTQRHVNQQSGYLSADSIGMGGYAMDSHHTQRWAAPGGVRNEGDVQVQPTNGPYGISYRSIVPPASQAENLLVPVAVSASHIAYGSIRMEPVFMILGQSAGAAAVRALRDGVSVQEVNYPALKRDLLIAGQVLTLNPPAASGVVVDNADTAAVTVTGAWTTGALPGAYAGNYFHDGFAGQGTKSVRFRPTLPAAGVYEVSARWVADTNRASNARFDIIHAAGTTTAPLMNQQLNGGAWVSLGSFSFAAGSAGSVLLRNDAANGYVIADAVQFTPVSMLPVVSVIAPVPATQETGETSGAFTVLRDGASTSDLTVQLTWSGSATAGSDYKTLPPAVTIPAGSIAVTLAVRAFADDTIEGTQTVTATISTNTAYSIASPAAATVSILDPPFDQWKSSYFTPAELSNPQISGSAADDDGDGRTTFLEFALGTSPRIADSSGLPALGWSPSGLDLRLYYRKEAEGVDFQVQQSVSLAPESWSHDGVSPETYDAASGLLYQSVPMLAEARQQFLRLQVR